MNLMKELKTYVVFLAILTISSLGGMAISSYMPFSDPTVPMLGTLAVTNSIVGYLAYKLYFKKHL